MLANKRKVLSLLLVVILASSLIACSNLKSETGEDDFDPASELVLVSAVPEIEATGVSPDLSEIVLKFNQQVKKAKVTVTDNSDISVAVQNKQVVVTGFNLKKSKVYKITYQVKSSQHQSITGSIRFITSISLPDISAKRKNETLMQTFYWDMGTGDYANEYPKEDNLWNLLAKRADKLAQVGITRLWLPPANKGWGGAETVGYDNYDLWDLGEFDQKGSVRTKYGTKQELEAALTAIHQAKMDAYYDVVLNHRMGADDTEQVKLSSHSPDLPGKTIKAWTEFNLAGRKEYYTKDKWGDLWRDFTWDKSCFDGVDWDESSDTAGIYLFAGKDWGYMHENRRSDYLMGSDVDYSNWDSSGNHHFNTQVVDEMKAWGQWITEDIGFDGFRLDAVKHVDSIFINQWIHYTEEHTSSKDLFFVGEAFIGNVSKLKEYIETVEGVREKESMESSNFHVFDFALRDSFAALRDQGSSFDLANLSKVGLVNSEYRTQAVTFVDNHDTVRGEYGGPIGEYAEQAYTYILMRRALPTIFWKDYYQKGMKPVLDKLLKIREHFAYGPAKEYPKKNGGDVYCYSRAGLENKPNTGLVMLLSDGTGGETITRTLITKQPNTTFIDYTGHCLGIVTTDSQGKATFKVKESKTKGWSVWVPVQPEMK